MYFNDQGDLIASQLQHVDETEKRERAEKQARMMNYDSDSIIHIMQEIDKLIDERREMIETIRDLQTRAAAHTQEPQPEPAPGQDEVCPGCKKYARLVQKSEGGIYKWCNKCGFTSKFPLTQEPQHETPLPNGGSFNPATESLLSELCAVLGWQGGTRADALERVRELNSIANRCAQDINYHQAKG